MTQQANFLTRLTYGFAVLLIVIGIAAYVTAEEPSFTAFIPSAVGVLLLGAAYATTRPDIGRYGGMGAVALVILLALGSMRGVVNFANAVSDGSDLTVGMISQMVIVLLSIAYLVVAGQHMRSRMRAH